MVVKTRTVEEAGYLDWVRPQILEELNIKELRPAEAVPGLYAESQAATGDDEDAVVTVHGYSANLDSGYMVAVDANITPELADEGLARELSHRIQNLRKSARFEITDRIVTYYQGSDDVARVMSVHGDYIKQETLSDDLLAQPPAEDAQSETAKVEGMEVTLGVCRVASA